MANIGGVVSSNPAGGNDINVRAAAGIGSQSHDAVAGVFAAGNDKNGPVTTGAFGELNANGHGLSIQHANTHGVKTSLTENARINVFKNDQHAVDINAFHSHNKFQNGLKFDAVGANTQWNSAQGHGASLGVTHIPKFNVTTMDATARANLWTSPNQASSFNLNTTASKHLSGPFAGKKDFSAGLGFTHRF